MVSRKVVFFCVFFREAVFLIWLVMSRVVDRKAGWEVSVVGIFILEKWFEV